MESLFSSLTQNISEKRLEFRNYVPSRDSLKQFVQQADTLVSEIELQNDREIFLSKAEFIDQQDEPLTLAPKQPNLDLKRNFNRKLEVLNKRTELAIVKLINDKSK